MEKGIEVKEEAFECFTPDGVSIRGLVFRSGEKRGMVILAHGFPQPQRPKEDPEDEGYPGLARRLCAEGFDAAIFNFRGTGESGGHLELEKWPDDLSTVMDYLGGGGFAVAGFSAGGAAAILQSAKDERIRLLVCMASPADFHFLQVDDEPEDWFEQYRRAGMIGEDYPGDAKSWTAGVEGVVPREVIGMSLAEQIVIVHGTEDESVPVAHAETLARAAGPKARKVLVEGASHRLRQDDRAVEVLIDQLRRFAGVFSRFKTSRQTS